MGHESIATTNLYLHFLGTGLRTEDEGVGRNDKRETRPFLR